MASILETIKNTKQPKNGFLAPSQFKEIFLNDELEITNEENIPLSLVGIVIDYMTRFLLIGDARNCFRVSLAGAMAINEFDKAKELLDTIDGLNDQSIVAACKLVGYDICFREHPRLFKPIETINPDAQTISNIKAMIIRCSSFAKEFGPIIKEGITFEGGYTDKITAGDGDFLTDGTMWDIKLSADGIDTNNTLQLLIHYIMGKHSNYPELQNVYKIGFFNPRLNRIYLMDASDIDPNVISEVEKSVIGY